MGPGSKKSDQYAISATLCIIATVICYFIWRHYKGLEEVTGVEHPFLPLVLIIAIFLLALGILFIILAIKGNLHYVLRLPSGFKSVGAALALFFLTNVFLYLLIYSWPSLVGSLSLSPNRPWGIITSAFVHNNLSHLSSNLFFFSIWSLFFINANYFVGAETRRHSSRIFLWLTYFSGFVANAIVYLMWSSILPSNVKSSYGASGVVYASAGVLMASALHNFSYSLKDLLSHKTGEPKRKLFGFTWSVFIFVLLFLYLAQDPKVFLGVAPGVNVFAHKYGFLLGFFLFWPSFYFKSLRKWIKSKK